MSQKRINKRQQELLVDKLGQNQTLARGNTADPDVKTFWTNLAVQLNTLGCSRTVREWQHVWQAWVQKVRGKARKVRDSLTGTGGGPSVPPMTEQENAVLTISGRAAVTGFEDLETPLGPAVCNEETAVPRNAPRALTPAAVIDDPWTPLNVPVVALDSPPQVRVARALSGDSGQRDAVESPRPAPVPAPEVNRIPRRRAERRPCRGQPAETDMYTEQLQRNSEVFREAITAGAQTIANALLESAQIIAQAIGAIPR